MGYETTFEGYITIEPPLNPQEIEFLTLFSRTHRLNRTQGPYFVGGNTDTTGVLTPMGPPRGQPNLNCDWTPSLDGKYLEWNGSEKFYDCTEWMRYLMDHFLNSNHLAPMPFLQGHSCNGTIDAQGEEMNDRYRIVVTEGKVVTQSAIIQWS